MPRIRARVEGRVQGVFYRASTEAEARRLGLTGWVRNLPDGAVELEAQGEGGALEVFLAWCHEGPPGARVTELETEPIDEVAGERGFGIRH